MEIYRFKLSPADRKSTINFKEIENNTSLFTTAAYNCTQGVSFKRDGKKIVINNIEETFILLTLYSASPLPSPSRTLSAFSRELLRLDKAINQLADSVYNHTLFSTEQIDIVPDVEITVNDISDTTLVKSIIDLLYSPSEDIKQEQLLSTKKRLKEIMLPFIKNNEMGRNSL